MPDNQNLSPSVFDPVAFGHIDRVGDARVTNPVPGPYVDGEPRPFFLDAEYRGEDAPEGAGQHLMGERNRETDPSGNPRLRDIGPFLQDRIKEYFARRGIPYYLKYIDPSYIIRSVPANSNDRVYCGFLGRHAVHAAMSGRTNMVVAKFFDHFVHLPLVTRRRRQLDVRGDYWRSVLESTGQELAMIGEAPFA